MFEQLEGEEVTETVTSPARHQLREINEKCTKLTGKRREGCYSIVQKLLWIMKRSRPDLETTIGFACTRVGKSYGDDWKKLHRGIYL